MNEDEPLRRMIEALDASGIPHMLAGSFASTHRKIDLILRKDRDFRLR